ncbi:HEAT repeat domain-containing protein [Streptomyces sp. NPDC048002]|uniref:HEAT repeat domain-containing protein n=1 Tax=Streptomyces sp. NPDC048002 TaxID=3154344 RepID=UPI0034027EC0
MLIGEVARRSGVSARMLRHYESLGLVRPTARSGSGYREYSDDDIRRVFHIESLRSLGLSLRDVGRALDDPDFAPARLVDDLIRDTRARIAAETELLTRLRRIDAAGPAAWDDVLRVVALLQALGSENADSRQRAALTSGTSGASGTELPAEALAEAALNEPEPNVAGTFRWALARSGDAGLPTLARGLDSPDPEVRARAVHALVALPGEAGTALLRRALADPDAAVHRLAALALGARGVPEAVQPLLDMVVAGTSDVDAADALGALAATDDTLAERIAAALTGLLAHDSGGPAARRRLTQALADIPGPAASRALDGLTHDEDRVVALTATYVLGLREERP